MSERVGYARCSRDKRDLTAQRGILLGRDVPEDRLGLAQALAAVRAGDTLVSVSRATDYRVLERHQNAATPSAPGGQ